MFCFFLRRKKTIVTSDTLGWFDRQVSGLSGDDPDDDAVPVMLMPTPGSAHDGGAPGA
jgi:hypothetical protein